MNVGAFAVDPGGATGIAWAVFDPKADSVADALKGKMLFGSTTVTGSEREQIREIAALWSDFYNACVNSALLPPDRVNIIFEDFIYKPGTSYGGDDSKISTALIWGVEGYRMGRADEWRRHKRGPVHIPNLYLQSAGVAKGYATNARLKDWGLWVVGRDHERSACQHLAYWLAQFMRHNS